MQLLPPLEKSSPYVYAVNPLTIAFTNIGVCRRGKQNCPTEKLFSVQQDLNTKASVLDTDTLPLYLKCFSGTVVVCLCLILKVQRSNPAGQKEFFGWTFYLPLEKPMSTQSFHQARAKTAENLQFGWLRGEGYNHFL